jgi:protease-4
MERFDIESDSIASHRLKGMGSITKKMTDEEREIFQGLVDESFTRFKEVIKSGRPKFRQDETALDKLATGQVFTTKQAIDGGLVDKEGFIEEAIDRAIELAKLDRDDVKVVKYKEPLDLGTLLLGAQSKQQGLDLGSLLDLASPRAFYLYTLLPVLKLE